MKIKLSFILFITSLLIISCTRNKTDNQFVINGKFINANNEKIYLEELNIKNITLIDSAIIDKDGKFSFQYCPSDIGFYILKIKNKNLKNFITLLADRGEVIDITAKAPQISKTYKVKGSKGSELLKEFYSYTNENLEKVDSLGKIFIKSQNNPEFYYIRNSLEMSYKKILNDQRQFVRDFIDKNSSSLASLIVINARFGNDVVLLEKDDFKYYEKLDNCLIKKYPNNKHVLYNHEKISEFKRRKVEKKLSEEKLSIGKTAPEVMLNDANDKPVALSSLRGKIVLIYFWASWSAASRHENVKLLKLYKKYKHKGFEIYAISFDKDKLMWTNAILSDKTQWIQVNELKYYDNPVAKLYNIDIIPWFYLIDRKGIIIDKGSKFNKLNKKLEKLLD